MKVTDLKRQDRQFLLAACDAIKDKLERITPRCHNCSFYWDTKCTKAPTEKIPADVLTKGCDLWTYDELELLI